MPFQINNPSGVSDLQRKRLAYLIDKGLIYGSAEGMDYLTYEEAQKIIDVSLRAFLLEESTREKKISSRRSELVVPPAMSLGDMHMRRKAHCGSQTSGDISPKWMDGF